MWKAIPLTYLTFRIGGVTPVAHVIAFNEREITMSTICSTTEDSEGSGKSTRGELRIHKIHKIPWSFPFKRALDLLLATDSIILLHGLALPTPHPILDSWISGRCGNRNSY